LQAAGAKTLRTTWENPNFAGSKYERKMKKPFLILTVFSASLASAQPEWTVQQCMQYAVTHNTQVRQAELKLDNYRANRLGAIGNMLPSVEASVGMQYNFGRAIDPETNIYTDVSTFYNGYSVQASLPVFDGFNRLHALRAAQASVLMGKSALLQQQDKTALNVMQAFTNVVYYDKMVRMADEKRRETALLLRQTQVMLEVGRKSPADVALVESQQAEADYELTRQQNLKASALLELKKEMNYPLADSLRLTCNEITDCARRDYGSSMVSRNLIPELQQAYQSVLVSRHEWLQARAGFFPTLSLSAGLSTSFHKTLHSEETMPFREQFKNNLGEYVSATLHIPLFNRLQTLTGIRRAKNNYRIAQEQFKQKQLELEKLSREAWQDMQAYQQQVIQMERKVKADSLAYLLTRRQYEEGLSTAIDLHTTSTQLLKSRATLLQCRLMAVVKEQLVRYYQGETIWTE